MPWPRTVARLNKRYTNRFIEPVVRRFAGFAVVDHHGRRTAASYSTPVYAFDADEAIVVALTYGSAADWVRNVLSCGGAIHCFGTTSTIVDAVVVDRSVAWPHLPRGIRFALRVMRVRDFLRIERSDPSPSPLIQ